MKKRVGKMITNEELYTITTAPNKALKEQWDILIGIDDIKQEALNHMLLSLDPSLITKWCTSYNGNPVDLQLELGIKGKVLLVGPSGTGKTVFARGLADAIARAKNTEVYLIEARLLREELVGKSSERVVKLFKKARELAKQKPVLIFFDEFDSVAGSRYFEQQHTQERDAVNTLLKEMENTLPSDNIVVVAATNLEKHVDFAMDRRFDLKLEFKRPSFRDRKELLTRLLGPFGIDSKVIYVLAKKTHGYTQADLKRVVFTAIEKAVFNQAPLSNGHLFSALHKVKPTRDGGDG
jgi:SpoVK/Ycf46/Vps4 family AAA+-type ATPase